MEGTILVPLDGMPLAETAIPFARLVAETMQARLELLRVVPENASADAEAQARVYLQTVANRCEVMPALSIMRGSPAACIVRRAAAISAELVVMCTHARSGLRRVVLGSVAEAVVAHASVPTVLVRAGAPPEPRLRTILVALDSTCATPVHNLTRLARAALASVVLVRVVPAEETAIWQWQPGAVLDEPQTLAIARGQLEDLAAQLEQNGIPARVRVLTGAAAPTIVALARDVNADVIIMATHARTGAQRTIVGSVTDAVVHHTYTPVLVARQIPMKRRRQTAT